MLLTALFSDIQALPFSTSYRLFFEAHNEVLELYPPTSKLCRFYLIQDYRFAAAGTLGSASATV
ncbi:hypothetical protein BVRB_9g203720 isoform A [Beta vulgaris subsp. vulgaris]|nr:hypothetical protein BVRB_9g203720 isoform A [Beta vulgaris subsp. vulgaris]